MGKRAAFQGIYKALNAKRAAAAALAAGAMAPEEAEAGPIKVLSHVDDAGRAVYKTVIDAWHGSPHRYPAERLVQMPDGTRQYLAGGVDQLPDVPAGAEVLQDYPLGRMRMDKIGTGEGAQAYGHGLYTADSPGVARGYRESLSVMEPDRIGDIEVVQLYDDISRQADYLPPKEAGEYYERAAFLERLMQSSDTKVALESIENPKVIEWARSEILPNYKPAGALYRTQIDVDPDTLLDWDKPLSEQPAVMEQLGRLQTPTGNMADDALGYFSRDGFGKKSNPTGSDLMDFLRAQQGSAQGASASAKQAGIPGIRYLDGTSRNAGPYRGASDPAYDHAAKSFIDAEIPYEEAKAGMSQAYPNGGDDVIRALDNAYGLDKTSNYVMFDDAPINIVERGNATPALLAGTAAATGAGMTAYSDEQDYTGRLNDAVNRFSAFNQKRESKRGGLDQLKLEMQTLLKGVNTVANDVLLPALDKPMQGYLGLSAAFGALASGGSFDDAVGAGARAAQAPPEQTTYNMGGVVTDTLSPYVPAPVAAGAGALTHGALLMGSPL